MAKFRFGSISLAELTLRVPRRRLWWVDMNGIGVASARDIEALFSRYPSLSESARRLRQAMVRGLKKVDQMFVLNMGAYNLVRLRSLAQVRPS